MKMSMILENYTIYLFWRLKIATKSGNTHIKKKNLIKWTQKFEDKPKINNKKKFNKLSTHILFVSEQLHVVINQNGKSFCITNCFTEAKDIELMSINTISFYF